MRARVGLDTAGGRAANTPLDTGRYLSGLFSVISLIYHVVTRIPVYLSTT
jgi:hypothetical protein